MKLNLGGKQVLKHDMNVINQFFSECGSSTQNDTNQSKHERNSNQGFDKENVSDKFSSMCLDDLSDIESNTESENEDDETKDMLTDQQQKVMNHIMKVR